MPTLDGENPGREPELGPLATHFGGKTPLGERFRRSQLRAQMFGDPGETVTIGRYRVTGQIGAGAMGTVYRAVDPSLDREVAVKVHHRSDEVHRARMTVEAKALAKLSHPNVVTVHEVGTEDQQLFVAMELVQGKTLQGWLQDPNGPRVLEVFVQAAEGLQAAHDAGIVHRDFKPENLIVGDDGRVRVLDFGMARTPGAPLLQEVDGEPGELQALEPAITRTGLLAGTPGYMAPEQFEGSRVDGRADQFAFCIALHEAIWGRRPFRGETVAELAKAVLGGEAHLFGGRVRDGLESHEIDAAKAVIERGLKTRPEERFGSMHELAGRLRGLPAIPKRRRGPARKFAAALSLAVLGAGGVLVYAGRQMENMAVEETIASGVEAVLSNRCDETVRYAFGDEGGPARPTHALERGQSIPVQVSNERRVWVLDDDGDPRVSGWTTQPGQELTIGPSCTQIATGPVGSYRAAPIEAMAAQGQGRQCGLGTEPLNGHCVPLKWDPSLVECADDRCTLSRSLLLGDDPLLLRQVLLVPTRTAQGTPMGFKLYRPRQGTAARLLGFENGDILRSVNDIKLEGEPAEVREALQGVARSADSITVVFERDGEVREQRVKVRGHLPWDPSLVTCDEGVCSIPRDYLVSHDGEDAIALQGFRAVPTSDAEGNLLGVELFGVTPGSVAHTVGLRSGDVVHEMNGVALTSMEASMLLEEQLFKDEVDTLRISFRRAGESETAVVKIVD